MKILLLCSLIRSRYSYINEDVAYAQWRRFVHCIDVDKKGDPSVLGCMFCIGVDEDGHCI